MKQPFDHVAPIESDDDQASPRDAGRFQHSLPAGVAEHDYVAQLSRALKPRQVRLDCNVGNFCCFENECDRVPRSGLEGKTQAQP